MSKESPRVGAIVTRGGAAGGRGRSGYSGGGAKELNDYVRERNTEADKQQNRVSRTEGEALYRQQYLDAIRNGVPAGELHPPTKGMDLKAANQRLSYATGGRGSADPGARPGPTGQPDGGWLNDMVKGPQMPNTTGRPTNGMTGKPVQASAQSTQAERDADPRRSWMGKEGVTNAPPINNAQPGQAATASLGGTRQVQMKPIPAPLTGGGLDRPGDPGNLTRDAANLRQSVGMYQPDGMIARPIDQVVASPEAGMAPVALPGAGQSRDLVNPYGTASVSMPQAYADGRPQTARDYAPAQPIMKNGVEVGVGRASQAEMRADLKKRYPEIWEKGSPENLAYVAHVKQHGEGVAYQNVDSIAAQASQTAQAAMNNVFTVVQPRAQPAPPAPVAHDVGEEQDLPIRERPHAPQDAGEIDPSTNPRGYARQNAPTVRTPRADPGESVTPVGLDGTVQYRPDRIDPGDEAAYRGMPVRPKTAPAPVVAAPAPAPAPVAAEPYGPPPPLNATVAAGAGGDIGLPGQEGPGAPNYYTKSAGGGLPPLNDPNKAPAPNLQTAPNPQMPVAPVASQNAPAPGPVDTITHEGLPGTPAALPDIEQKKKKKLQPAY